MKQVKCTGLDGSSLGKALGFPFNLLDLFLGRNPLEPWRGASNPVRHFERLELMSLV